jgi:hypothetical protein
MEAYVPYKLPSLSLARVLDYELTGQAKFTRLMSQIDEFMLRAGTHELKDRCFPLIGFRILLLYQLLIRFAF